MRQPRVVRTGPEVRHAHAEFDNTTALQTTTTENVSDISESSLERIVGRFLNESSIRWLLVTGAAIVFASSLMLVTRAWPSLTVPLKFSIILGYTAAIFAAAEFSRMRLRLRATSRVLQLLTLLLLPVVFLSFNLLSHSGDVSRLMVLEQLALLLPAVVFLWFASSRILDHLLAFRQTTFLLSYQLLCIAGALPQITSASMATAFVFGTWAIYSMGAIKVSRHIFWLTEQHHKPRLPGFLPVVLPGLQFVLLAALKTVQVSSRGIEMTVPLHATGFCLVLTAATFLVSGRPVFAVFRQRTGNMVRPLPAVIVLPLFTALVLATAGVCLAFSGFSLTGPTTYTVIPAAALAGLLMWTAAVETRLSPLTWCALVFFAIAYQCSPTLFAGIVQRLKDGIEVAIHERRLPVAFYGITWLPLIFVAAIGTRMASVRSEESLRRPLKWFSTGAALLLFAVSATNLKALFVVSAVNFPAFLLLGIVFNDRRCVLPALAALVLAAATAVPALRAMHLVDLSSQYTFVVLGCLAVVLTVWQLPDRLTERISVTSPGFLRHRSAGSRQLTKFSLLLQHSDGTSRRLFQLTGLLLVWCLMLHWIFVTACQPQLIASAAGLSEFSLVFTAAAIAVFRRPDYLRGLSVWLLTGFTVVAGLRTVGITDDKLADLLTLSTALLSVAAYLTLKLAHRSDKNFRLNDVRDALGFPWLQNSPSASEGGKVAAPIRRLDAIGVPLCDLTDFLLCVLLACVHIPRLVVIHFQNSVVPSVPAATLMAFAWLVGAAVVHRNPAVVAVTTLVTSLFASAGFLLAGVSLSPETLLLVWAGSSAALFAVSNQSLVLNHNAAPAACQLRRMSGLWLCGISAFAAMTFDFTARAAAAFSVAALAAWGWKTMSPRQRTFLLIGAQIHVLLLAAAVGGARGGLLQVPQLPATCCVLWTVFALHAAWDRMSPVRSARLDAATMRTWVHLLRGTAAVLMISTLTMNAHGIEGLVTAVAMVLMAGSEVHAAVRRRKPSRLQNAHGVVILVTIFLLSHGYTSFDSRIFQSGLLGLSLVALLASDVFRRRPQLSTLSRLPALTGAVLPCAAVVIMLLQSLSTDADARITAVLIMAAAGLYVWRASVTGRRRFVLAAAVLANTALACLWRSFGLWNAEFYLVPAGLSVIAFVQVLKAELPAEWHSPLRYSGALMILVSPALELFGESWVPGLVLLVLSVLVVIGAVALRLRPLLYTGTAFLAADLLSMVLRIRVEHPLVPWFLGLLLGLAVLVFAAFCENHREHVLSRIRLLSARLATWQ